MDTGAGWTELATIALGFVLASVGVGAIALWTAYRRAGDLTLLSFGLLTSLYGARILISVGSLQPLFGLSRLQLAFATAFVIYALPAAGLLYARQIRGPGWRSSLHWLSRAAFVLAAIFIGYDTAAGQPWASLPPYRIFVIVVMVVLLPHVVLWRHHDAVETVARGIGTTSLALAIIHDNLMGFRLLPWRVSLEVFGVGIFILALGVVTARRFFADQRQLAVVEGELATAREIQAAILPQRPPHVPTVDIAVRFLPARLVAGDFYDFLAVDDARVALIVADVTGHSVPAALIASMVKVAFSSQRQHASDPGRLLTGMNRALSGHFEGRFVTAACLFIDAARPTLRYSLAGHPPPLLRRRSTGEVVELTEGGIVLGLFADSTYPTGEVAFDPGDRLVVYTDGVAETTDAGGRWFGERELKAFVGVNGQPTAEAFLDAFMSHLHQWSGRGDRPFDDDVTLLAVDRRTAPADGDHDG